MDFIFISPSPAIFFFIFYVKDAIFSRMIFAMAMSCMKLV